MYDPSLTPPKRGFATRSEPHERSVDSGFFDFALFAATITFFAVAAITIYLVHGPLDALTPGDLGSALGVYFGPAGAAAAAMHRFIRWLPHRNQRPSSQPGRRD